MSGLDIDAIEERAKSPWCDGCGEQRYKCACAGILGDGATMAALCAEVRALRNLLAPVQEAAR